MDIIPSYLSEKNWNLIKSESESRFNRKLFGINRSIGKGQLEIFEFEDLSLQIYDLTISNNFSFPLEIKTGHVYLSFLLHGEQIIRQKNAPEVSYGDLESYWIKSNNFQGDIFFPPQTKWHEIRISLKSDFAKKYHLDRDGDHKIQTRVLDPRERTILLDILKNKSEGILKFIFIEGKTLELSSIRMDDNIFVSRELTSCPKPILKNLFHAKEIIAENLNVQFSIYHLAKKIGMNESSLKKEFKRVFNTTITQYTFTLRMQKATDLLKHSDQAIYEISDAVGYKNPTHFTAAFKKMHGCTPKTYRNLYLKKEQLVRG